MKIVGNEPTQKEILDVAHHNTIFNQLLSLIPRHDFEHLVSEHAIGRRPRQFSHWNQFVHLSFIQIAARKGLRDGVRNMNANSRQLYHLGARPVARSTFSDANNARPADLLKAVSEKAYHRCLAFAPGHGFRFKNKLYSLDATTLRLCLETFPWAAFRKRRGGIKLHTLVDHDGLLPAVVNVTPPRTNEAKMARTFNLPKGSIVIFDRGFTDYRWFNGLSASGIFFVTRQKKNAVYKVLARHPVNKKQGVTSEQTPRISSRDGTFKLRRVGFRDETTGNH